MRQFGLNCLLFFAAGLAGLVRYSLTLIFPDKGGLNITILLINYLGIALLAYYIRNVLPAKGMHKDWQDILGIGFFGGFTTIASPLLDAVLAIQSGNWLVAIEYGVSYIIGGFLVAFLAYDLAGRRLGR